MGGSTVRAVAGGGEGTSEAFGGRGPGAPRASLAVPIVITLVVGLGAGRSAAAPVTLQTPTTSTIRFASTAATSAIEGQPYEYRATALGGPTVNLAWTASLAPDFVS